MDGLANTYPHFSTLLPFHPVTTSDTTSLTTKYSNTLRFIVIFTVIAYALGTALIARAEVQTDQEDYAPGSVVTISGNHD